MIKKNKGYFYFLTKAGYGLGSEINNILYMIYYFNKKKKDYKIISSNWNSGYNKGWSDYFNSPLQTSSSINNNWTDKKETFWNDFFENPIDKVNKLPSIKFRFAKFSKQIKNRNKSLGLVMGRIQNLFFPLRYYTRKYPTFRMIHRYCSNQRNKNRKEFYKSIHNILSDIWIIRPEILSKINSEIPTEPYICIHIRRGDKITSGEDKEYNINDYIKTLSKLNSNVKTIFLMSDDYNAYLELKKNLPEYNILTKLNEDKIGHNQKKFNSLSQEKIKKETILLLTEIEIAKRSEVFIGTFASNLFRLIEYFKLDNCYDISNVKQTAYTPHTL